MITLILDDAAEKMEAAVSHARQEFSSVRTGRASSALVERLPVEAYGSEMRMLELASFSVPEARLLVITPHDAANMDTIERAIRNSQLGLNPSNDGRVIRLAFPTLTEERRKDLVRVVGGMAEESKNRLRGVRRTSRKELDDLENEGGISKDEIKVAADQLDLLTKSCEAEIDSAQETKEQELLEV